MSLSNLNSLKSNAIAVDDSGTESGEEVNQKILVQVQGALANLESALPALDPLRRSSVVELLTKLQTSLKLSTDKKPTPPPRKCWNHKKTGGGRQDRHTVGVSSEELQDARRWLEENGYADATSASAPAANPASSACSTPPRSYDAASATKTFRPVKFVPPPPKRTHYAEDYIPEPSKRSLQNSSFACPPAQHAVVVDSPIGGGVDRRRRGASSSNERETTDSSGGDVTSADDDDEDGTDDDCRSVSSAQRLLRIASCNDLGRKFRQGKRAKLKQRPGTGGRDDRDHSSGDDCHGGGGGGRGQQEPVVNRVPPFEPKTASDKKYLALMRHAKRNDDAQSAAVAAAAYNPLNGKLQGNWGNRFGRIKTAFERGATATAAAVESPKKSLAKAFWHDICKCPSDDSIAYRRSKSGGAPSSSSFRPTWSGENGFSHGTRSAFKPVAPHKVNVPFSSMPVVPPAPQPVSAAAPVRPKPDHPKHLPLYNSSVATAHRPFIYTSPDRPAEEKTSPWSLTSPSDLTTTSCSASPLADYDALPTTATSRVMGSPQTASIVKSKTCHRSLFPSPPSPHTTPSSPRALPTSPYALLPGPPAAMAAPRYPSAQPQPPTPHYNAPAPVVQAPRPPPRSPRPVRQQRSPTSSPVRMPSVLQKSESWHQMIMGQSKAAARLPVTAERAAATTRHVAPYQGYLPREQIAHKQNIVRQHLQAAGTGSSGTSSKCASPRLVKLNDDIDKVDDTFESLFKEATKAK